LERRATTSSDRHAPAGGVIVGHDLVVTNAHVIEHDGGFTLGRSRAELTLVAVDPLHDLALLQGPVGGLALPIRIASPIWLGEAIMRQAIR
jgi:S1-C subfamily serine protease